MFKNPPKTFQKLASNKTLEGIKKSVCAFYCCSSLEFKEGTEPDTLQVVNKSGAALTPFILETKRGFYFGYYPQAKQ